MTVCDRSANLCLLSLAQPCALAANDGTVPYAQTVSGRGVAGRGGNWAGEPLGDGGGEQ